MDSLSDIQTTIEDFRSEVETLIQSSSLSDSAESSKLDNYLLTSIADIRLKLRAETIDTLNKAENSLTAAERYSTVKSSLPKVFNRLLRPQHAVNRAIIQATRELTELYRENLASLQSKIEALMVALTAAVDRIALLEALKDENKNQPLNNQPTYLGNHYLLTDTKAGYPLILDNRDVGMTPTIVKTGEWEPELGEVYRALLKPGMRCVEIGAHVGYFTLLAAGLVGGEGKVYAFEPNLSTFDFLIRNIRLNNVGYVCEAFSVGISDQEGEAIFHAFERNQGSSSLSALPKQILNELLETPKEINVHLQTLDSIKPLQKERIDFVKIDAEGAEFKILKGGNHFFKNCLSPNAVVAMEVNPPALQGADSSVQELYELIREYGFHTYRLEEYQITPISEYSELNPWCITQLLFSSSAEFLTLMQKSFS